MYIVEMIGECSGLRQQSLSPKKVHAEECERLYDTKSQEA
jgi:hypothetical protein